METLSIGIIPLAGNASRIKNIPKYLLPCKSDYTLIDNTIEHFNNNNINLLYAGVSDNNNFLLQKNNKLNKLVVDTKTMAETVYLIIQSLAKTYYEKHNNILIMPDTYFKINDEISILKRYLESYKIVVLVWNIKDYQIGKVGQCKIENDEIVDIIDKDPSCTYEYFWGVIGWNNDLNKYIDPNWETIGNLIEKAIELKINVKAVLCKSNYYDCGTFQEYFKMIKNEI